ncbi:MAG: hypothetical protein A2268_08175 [Candidatus Raymondbacteria bacterium RifOxyA12_full_50_37]|uniref:DUF2442 domain-containing protein n=1 Tax=Candidatus Raymondbacteria bacterium RIFOXYD12_FULL_49_13 TaxID=1817890 RepID=A0A1F7FD16_UNCRA|nr:MAG: hypothetical protein A2268_08175 [Candidatus Raymondbacteria bacterium RifOxyA12_full_50_37]OGJ93543.1 MAG: hypothetical protein A2248_09220 [Candidatus Raymondbacteria bacterium RIFOXYA2_FULL_49_16]OGJ98813.1 MAG: hypothetical protein A2453_10030 [Candidatus Raymondbacteria bacterium RIFOXYC2_FULL_50_21]OGK02438.1 MAG: hypothetical protein A2350_11530 [Candidatus Raymondbacteria bacterium RifOxyB12_full_50_8]OGK04543.1 MAG: hypothetical protein A2519_07165 [Candidatus Raymondbacteria b
MPTLALEASAAKIWFDNEQMWLLLNDGRQLAVPLPYFPRLLKATPAARMKYELSGGGTGIHWDEIDEDISVPHLLMGHGDVTKV